MKQLVLSLTLVIFLSTLLPRAVDADIVFDPEMKLFGEVRTRVSVDDRSILASTPTLTYLEMRTRLGLRVVVDSHATAVIGFQDSRYAGNYTGSSTQLADQNEIDLWQAYIEVHDYGFEGWGLRVGRFPLSFGNERVIGVYDWDQVGRFFEGGLFWFEWKSLRWDGFWFVLRERNHYAGNLDYDLQGTRLSFADAEWDCELLFFLESNSSDERFVDEYVFYEPKFRNTTASLYLSHDHELFGGLCNLAYQYGKTTDSYLPMAHIYGVWTSGLWYAHMVQAEVFVRPLRSIGLELRGGFDYSSGQPPDGAHIFGYRGRFMSSHRFQGAMDYFPNLVGTGLIDKYGQVKLSNATFEFESCVHLFKSPVEYTNWQYPRWRVHVQKIGWEIDNKLTVTAGSRVSMEVGFSFFSPSKELVERYGVDNRTTWGYGQIRVQF